MTLRRVFDVVASAIGLTVVSVPLAAAAVVVACSSTGPIIFRQRRIGAGGRPFWLYKFRTMHVNAEGPGLTVDDDGRVYPAGRFLRRWKIDELPQLWNVLRGDMSIIGPRPEVEQFVRHYTPEQACILAGKPGLASVSTVLFANEAELLRHATDPVALYISELMPRKLAVDIQYERRRTFWTDLRLLADIALSVVRRRRPLDPRLSAPFAATDAGLPDQAPQRPPIPRST